MAKKLLVVVGALLACLLVAPVALRMVGLDSMKIGDQVFDRTVALVTDPAEKDARTHQP